MPSLPTTEHERWASPESRVLVAEALLLLLGQTLDPVVQVASVTTLVLPLDIPRQERANDEDKAGGLWCGSAGPVRSALDPEIGQTPPRTSGTAQTRTATLIELPGR